MMTNIRLIIGMALMLVGVVAIAISVIGIYRFRFVMNRMHAAAIVDTLGLMSLILGLILITWNLSFLPKLLLVLLVQWVGSPLASHMVGELEIRTDHSVSEHMAEDHMEEKEE